MWNAVEWPIARASLNLTRACNLRCPYCFTYGCTKGRMSPEIAQRSVDFLINQASRIRGKERFCEISFWGGEPLLEWSLLQDIVLYAEKQGAKAAVPVRFGGTTNGTLLTEEKFDFLDKHKLMFLVSWDGTEESHDVYRKFHNGKGSHAVIAENMRKVLAKWPNYRVRMSITADTADRFFEDCRYLFDFGLNYLMFSPVYETNWTEEKWNIWEIQSLAVIDYMKVLLAQGRKVQIEHFRSYTGGDKSEWPCGAGRFYVGIDIDGAIYPCHRFNKFNDERPWQEKELCIGHIDYGITRPEFRERFIKFTHLCGNCPRLIDTPCHGGCYAVNFDMTGNVETPHPTLCRYVEAQKRISNYYRENLPMPNRFDPNNEISCMPYKGKDWSCECYNAAYSGEVDPESMSQPQTKPCQPPLDMNVIVTLLKDMNRRLVQIEEKLK